MWRLDVSSEAELEIFEAALRYEREREGLGFRFEAQVNTIFARLVENPFQCPAIEEGARRALVRDFPYGVFFTTKADLNNSARGAASASAPRHLETRTSRYRVTCGRERLAHADGDEIVKRCRGQLRNCQPRGIAPGLYVHAR